MTRAFATSPSGIVLLYHRVARLDTDPQLLAVTPEHFAEHLDVLARMAVPTPLRKMWSASQDNSLRSEAVAITFDDGYADNFREAEPLLRVHGIPATIFATTGLTGTDCEFFWDELDRLLLQPNTLPAELFLDGVRIETATCAQYPRADWEKDRGWNVLDPARPGSRQVLYLDLCGRLHAMTADKRQDGLRQLQDWAGVAGSKQHRCGRESHRMMTAAELREIAASELVEIGAHTVTHPRLAGETIDRQIDEIRQSQAFLESTIGRPVKSFSYPFGTRRDYTAATITAVRDAGFELACSNFTGKVSTATDPFQIPRFIVRDWDGDQFERQLTEWFALLQSPNRPAVATSASPSGSR